MRAHCHEQQEKRLDIRRKKDADLSKCWERRRRRRMEGERIERGAHVRIWKPSKRRLPSVQLCPAQKVTEPGNRDALLAGSTILHSAHNS